MKIIELLQRLFLHLFFLFMNRNLKNTSVPDIIQTIAQHKLKFSHVFKNNLHIPDRHVNLSFGINFLVILDLTTRQQQFKMYRTIRDEITDIGANGLIPNVNSYSESVGLVWF